MNRRKFMKTIPAITALAGGPPVLSGISAGPDYSLQPIVLPKPGKDSGKSVLTAMRKRRTIREIRAEKLPPRILSDLLWAAYGVNREKTALGMQGRTAPSASNSQEIDLYVATAEGVFRYEAVPHRLAPVASGDFRALAGRNGSTAAPVHLFYVADLSRYDTGPDQPDPHIADPEVQKSYYYTDTGFIAQNVYLFAAANGLAAWFRNCRREDAAREFHLRPDQRVLFAQSVGFPLKP
jgi:nitroreductase